MREFKAISQWLAQETPHNLSIVDSLPDPTFWAAGHRQVSFSTNNYLALASSPRLIAAARRGLDTYGVGNCESRLLGGNLEIYHALENKLAKLKRKDGAVLFATGYLANLGVLSSLPRTGRYARIYGYRMSGVHSYAYFGDEFNHLSIRDGIRNSGAERHTYRHCDIDHLEALLRSSQADGKIIATDGVFSQDGDIAPLPDLLALAERYDAMLYVDDAHGTGVLGAHGEGTSEHFGVTSERLIQMGTLSKAYGAIGGFIAADKYITEILRLSCGAYGFTSTLPPDQAVAVSEAIDASRDEPQRRAQLWNNQRYFIKRMAQLPYSLVATTTPIVPIMIGDESLSDKFSNLLRAEGIHVDAVKFPAVPMGKSRLRVQLNAGHSHAQIDHFVEVLEDHQHLVGGKKYHTQPRPIFAKAWASSPTARPWAIAAFTALTPGLNAARSAFAGLRDKAASAFGRTFRSMNPHQLELRASLALVTLASAILVAIDLSFDIPHSIFAYLLPILFVATRFGRLEALVVTTVIGLCEAFFLYAPKYSFYVEDPRDLAELAIFCAIASLITQFFGERSERVEIRRR